MVTRAAVLLRAAHEHVEQARNALGVARHGCVAIGMSTAHALDNAAHHRRSAVHLRALARREDPSAVTIASLAAAAERDITPGSARCDAWLPVTDDDAYLALLCAAVELAAEQASETRDRMRAGEASTTAYLLAVAARNGARADLCAYLGQDEDLDDVDPAVALLARSYR